MGWGMGDGRRTGDGGTWWMGWLFVFGFFLFGGEKGWGFDCAKRQGKKTGRQESVDWSGSVGCCARDGVCRGQECEGRIYTRRENVLVNTSQAWWWVCFIKPRLGWRNSSNFDRITHGQGRVGVGFVS